MSYECCGDGRLAGETFADSLSDACSWLRDLLSPLQLPSLLELAPTQSVLVAVLAVILGLALVVRRRAFRG